MKLISLVTIALVASFMWTPAEHARPQTERSPLQRADRVVAAELTVVVTLCSESGSIVVRGWDRREVRARSRSRTGQVEFRSAGAPLTSSPATNIEVLISGPASSAATYSGECRGSGEVELDVPRGATVELRTRDGDISVSDIAQAHIETQSGDIDARRISKVIEATSMSGDVSVTDSTGLAHVRTISGDIAATNTNPLTAGDDLEAKSVSGDVILDRIGHTRLSAVTLSGNVSMVGPLVTGGHYEFKTTSGDITITLARGASFQVDARVSEQDKIITDLPLKSTNETTGSRQYHFTGSYGLGDVMLKIYSFSGTVHLQRK